MLKIEMSVELAQAILNLLAKLPCVDGAAVFLEYQRIASNAHDAMLAEQKKPAEAE